MKIKLLLLLLLFSTLFSAFAQKPLESISLQLKWKHGYQFAGYYAAQEKGFYADEGLDVKFLESNASRKHYIGVVTSGEAEYGVADTNIILTRKKGKPVVWLSQIFQHSPLVLMTLKKSGIVSPYEMAGKTAMYDILERGSSQIHLMIRSVLGDQADNIIFKGAPLNYNELTDENVDIISGYLTDQPYYYKSKGYEINIIDPRSYGIDFYGDNLFTTEKEINEHPERVNKMIRASLKGWEYALEHPEEIIKIILKKYNSQNKTLEHLRYEAKTTRQMIIPDLVPLGNIDEGRLNLIMHAYQRLGLVDEPEVPQGLIYDRNKTTLKLSHEEKNWLRNNDKIRLAITVGNPPAVMLDSDGKIVGIIPEYIQHISWLIGKEIELVTYDHQKEGLEEIYSDTSINGTALLFENDSNRKLYHLTPPFFESTISIYTNKKNSGIIQHPVDLRNKKVAVLKNHDTAIAYVNKIENIELVFVESPEKQLELLQSEKVDAAIGYLTYNYLINKSLFTNIVLAFTFDKPLDIVMGIKRDNVVLRNIIDKAIANIDESVKQRILYKWLRINNVSPDHITRSLITKLTDDERLYLKSKKVIKMCVDPYWMPFEMIKDGKHVGITADFINIMQDRIKTPIELVKTDSWIDSLEIGKLRGCDIFSLVMPTPERKKFLNFTKPYIRTPLVVVTKIDEQFIDKIESITNKKIGIPTGYAFGELLKKKYPQMKLIEVKNQTQGLDDVKHGRLFGFIGTLATSGYMIQQNYIGTLKIAGKFDDSWELGIGTRNDEPYLLSIFDKVIDSISETDRQKIINKWISVKYEKGIDYSLFWKTFSFLMLVTLFFVYKNSIMKRLNKKLALANDEIQIKTKQLEEKQRMLDSYVMITSTDLNGIITSANSAFCKASGYTEEELIGQNHNIVKHPENNIEFYQEFWKSLNEKGEWSGEIRNLTKDNKTLWIYTAIFSIVDENGIKTGYRSIKENITDKKRIEELSITDSLTGIYNRLMIDEIINNKIYEYERYKAPFSIVILDIDNFKEVNDEFGHDVGDNVLKKVAAILNANIRKTDIVGRWGGEEFVIVCSKTKLNGAYELAEKVRLKIYEENFDVAGKKTISLGVAEYNDLDSFSSIFKRADNLLYKAKHNGKNQTMV